jgi:hypothetical protein
VRATADPYFVRPLSDASALVTNPVVAIASPDARTATLCFVFTSIGLMPRILTSVPEPNLRLA